MSNFDAIDEALNVESEIVKAPKKSELINVSEDNSLTKGSHSMEESKKDYEYTRSNLYSLIEKGQEAVNGALELATEGDSARSYEVAGQLIKHVADVTDKLLDLQKKVKDLDSQNITNNQTNVTNNSVFVGSTTELAKMLKNGVLNNTSD
jgi:hypothetical protein